MLRKSIFVLALLAPIVAITGDVITHDNEYLGLKLGEATYTDMLAEFGPPLQKRANSNNVRYRYDGFDVTIQDKTGRLNTVIVYSTLYEDKNSHKVGDKDELLKNRNYIAHNPDPSGIPKVYSDSVNGIFYWMKDGKVHSIVLAYKTKIPSGT